MRQFVVLSVLGHILIVVLLGDASGVRRDGRSWGHQATFLASLDPRPTPLISTPQKVPRLPSTATPAPAAPAPTAEPHQPSAADASTAIAPLAVIAVEVERPRGQFVVPQQNIELSAPVLPPPIPVISAIPKPEGTLLPRSVVATTPIPTVVAPIRPPTASSATPVLQSTLDHQAVILPNPTILTLPVLLAPPEIVSAVPQPTPLVMLEKNPLNPVEVNLSTSQNMPISPTTPPSEVARTITESQREIKTIPSVNDRRPSGEAVAGKQNESGGAPMQTNDRRMPSLLPVVPVVPTVPVTPQAVTGPKLDLDSLRGRARQLTADGEASRRALPFPTVAKDTPKRDIEKIFDKALKRPDCKEEYANMGLAAVVPLVRDAVKGDGCKW